MLGNTSGRYFRVTTSGEAHGDVLQVIVDGISAGLEPDEFRGSESKDTPCLDGDRIRFRANHAGGLPGGISNRDDIVLRVVVKPASQISIERHTGYMFEMKEVLPQTVLI
ncbi:MAG: chorismate synthase [Anaerolineales bacterium]|nr:chorismate synthase [Anaerolineales bacterium]